MFKEACIEDFLILMEEFLDSNDNNHGTSRTRQSFLLGKRRAAPCHPVAPPLVESIKDNHFSYFGSVDKKRHFLFFLFFIYKYIILVNKHN